MRKKNFSIGYFAVLLLLISVKLSWATDPNSGKLKPVTNYCAGHQSYYTICEAGTQNCTATICTPE